MSAKPSSSPSNKFSRVSDLIDSTYTSVIIPLSLILISEAFFFINQQNLFMMLNLLNLLICVFMSVISEKNANIWQTFSLIFVLLIFDLGMPRFFTTTIYWELMIYIIMVTIILFSLRDDINLSNWPRNLKSFFNKSFNLNGWNIYYVPVAMAIVIAWFLENIELKVPSITTSNFGLVPDFDIVNLILLFIMALFVALGEELIFRYLLQNYLVKSFGVAGGILISSIAFMSVYAWYSSDIYLVFIFLLSILLGVAYYMSNSLSFVTLIHCIVILLLFPYSAISISTISSPITVSMSTAGGPVGLFIAIILIILLCINGLILSFNVSAPFKIKKAIYLLMFPIFILFSMNIIFIFMYS